uniref:Uncharacterized protein n=1 Tax=viral metagenome TaxID=1070528 RepID=A0A6M3KL91_9ZZZZ
MLVRLLPNDISNNWVNISTAIVKGLQPIGTIDEDSINRLLEASLTEELQLWLIIKPEKEVQRIIGLVSTVILIDPILRTKSLLVYSLFGVETIPGHIWVEGIETLRKFAKGNSCTKVCAFSNLVNVVEILKLLGADTSWHYISMEV